MIGVIEWGAGKLDMYAMASHGCINKQEAQITVLYLQREGKRERRERER